jgi:hypothetical protein
MADSFFAAVLEIVDYCADIQIRGPRQSMLSMGDAFQKLPKELHLKFARLKAVRRFGWEVTDFGDDNIACGGDGNRFSPTTCHCSVL